MAPSSFTGGTCEHDAEKVVWWLRRMDPSDADSGFSCCVLLLLLLLLLLFPHPPSSPHCLRDMGSGTRRPLS